jgi:drug/metabolite transporter (DMT)-like permease
MRSYWPLILLLAAMWGASYLFIKVAVEDIPPAAMTDMRLAIAGLLLTAYLVLRTGVGSAVGALRRAWIPCLVLGIVNAAIPMTLVAWGETHIDSSIAGIAQSSVPIFVAIFGLRFLPHDPLRGAQVVGLAVGLSGVMLITGVHPDGGAWAIVGTLAVVLSSVSYAAGGIYGQLHIHDTPGPVLAAGSMIVGAIALLPLAIADPPTQAPGATALAGLLALALIPTFLGQLPLFCVLRLFGPPPVAGDVPHAWLRRRIRCGAARGDHRRDRTRRARADPRRSHPRLGAAALRRAGAGERCVSVSIRRARADDADFLVELVTHADVEPFLAAVRSKGRDEILAEIARSDDEPEAFGVFVIEVDGELAGTMRFTRANQRSRIADLGGLAVHPDFGEVADTAVSPSSTLFRARFHRVQMEIWLQRGAMRRAEAPASRARVSAGAYWRDEEWVDSVLYGPVAE